MRWSIASAMSALALTFASSASAQGVQVEWRVGDRFRLFDQADLPARQRVTAFMDQILDAPGDVDLVTFHDDYVRTVSGDDAASLRRSNYRAAGDGENRPSGRYDHRYLFPHRYRVEIRVNGVTDPTQRCTYRSPVDEQSGPCGDWTRIDIADGVAVSNANWRIESNVIVATPDGGTISQPVSFTDQLVVALGDSYISGEGNPDVPSRVTVQPDPVFQRPSWAARLNRNQHVQEAEWWDEPCHRSLLSWPVIASFLHSARNPQHSVTLVHLGCSGAVVPEVIDTGERGLPGGGNEILGQLEQLNALLQPPTTGWGDRRADTVFLSIGGNDVGFAGVIATLALPPNGYTVPWIGPAVVGRIADAVCPYDQRGQPLSRLCSWNISAQTRLRGINRRLEGISQRFARLRDSLVPLVTNPQRIFHAQYPNALLDANERPCDTSPGQPLPGGPSAPWSGFEGLMGYINSYGRGWRFNTWNFELMYVPEADSSGSWEGEVGRLHPNADCDWLPEETDSEICQAMWVHARLNREIARGPFTDFDEHVDAIRRNGLCVQSLADRLALPLVEDGQWVGGWTPRSLRPYDSSNVRWFRVPNDSIVTQYGFHSGERRFHHGTAHPTFRAHLEVAKAAYSHAFAPDR